jgi:uncharacterized membrane protein
MIEFIGRLHPVLVHLPIGILMLAVLFEWLSAIKKFRSLKKSQRLIIWIGACTAVLSCITGYVLSQSGDYDQDAVSWHQWSAITLTLFALAYAWIKSTKKFKPLHRFFSVLVFLFVVVTGHLGGSLTHGEDYLSLFNVESESMDLAAIDLKQALFYDDLVKPILSEKCYSCHGSSKQKGKLRLDAPEHILKGGKGGAVIVSGNVEESELMYRVLLPMEDDDHMPPKEKGQLSEREMEVLNLWIASGADFNKSVAESGQLAAMQKIISTQPIKAVSSIPEDEVAPAPEEILNELRKLGVVILPIATGTNYLSANLINATSIDSAINAVAMLRDQLVWLKLGDQPVTDSHLSKISSLKNVVRLSLENTAITDAGLSELAALSRLQYLNLTGTSITSEGLSKLGVLKELRSVYVFKTGIKPEELEILRKQFVNTTIESGNYEVPTLETDTTLVKFPVTN